MLQLKQIVKEYVTDVAATKGKQADSEEANDGRVVALKGVDVAFRANEFVAILGQSGCGKTTMLNIIGGLDHYTSGDLIINGKSTKLYKDRDWDSYRNNSIGFVFQSYNLIPHQSVLANVELALTLSGVSKAERRSRAVAALEKVGLKAHMKKRPNQMSGGQMQRVAIARALVNNPDILLADEPTGALDSETSVQIMDLLKEVAKDRLVIMVTHNQELAEEYATRIVRLKDGLILDDTDPYKPTEAELEAARSDEKVRKTSMSLATAFSLSLNNLMTKKGRTILTAFAGSIGIIGIALILSLSNGVNEYINRVQEDTLSSYPLTISTESMDLTSLMGSIASSQQEKEEHDLEKIYSSDQMGTLVNAMVSGVTSNNLSKFRDFLETDEQMQKFTSGIKYRYNISLNIYTKDADDNVIRVYPDTVMSTMLSSENINDAKEQIEKDGGTIDETLSKGMSMSGGMMSSSGNNLWIEMIDDRDLLAGQYDVVAGKWPENYNEVMIIADENNEISDYTLYSLGLRDRADLKGVMVKLLQGQEVKTEGKSFTYDELLGLKYSLVLSSDYYEHDEDANKWNYKGDDEDFLKKAVENGIEISVVGIARPNPDALSTSLNTSTVAYTSALTEYAINYVNDSEIVKQQKADETIDVLSNLPFVTDELKNITDEKKIEKFKEYLKEAEAIDKAKIYLDYVTAPNEDEVKAQVEETMSATGGTRQGEEALFAQLAAAAPDATFEMEEGQTVDMKTLQSYVAYMEDDQLHEMLTGMLYSSYYAKAQEELQNAADTMTNAEMAEKLDEYLTYATDEQFVECYDKYMPEQYVDKTYEDNLAKLQSVDMKEPRSISIYVKTFEDKDDLTNRIDEYNKLARDEDREDDVITYTDMVGLMMSSISTIINSISYILIAFVAISLVVSSIMIGIITYISVLERTKEIGILRAIGASKKDITHVFNAETVLIGLTSGLIGIGVTLLLLIPINIIVKALTDISNLAVMPWAGAIILIAISVFLTLIGGLLPSKVAAKKDPVVALRTE